MQMMQKMRPMVELYNSDCLKILKQFEAMKKEIDIIVTSPPYNMNLRVNMGKYVSRVGKGNQHEFSAKYKNYTDDLTMDEYFKFQKAFLNRCLKISPLVFYNIQPLTGNKRALFKLMGEFNEVLKEIIVWDKGHGQPAMAERMLNSAFELILIFDREKAYNRQFDSAYFTRGTENNIWHIPREPNKISKASFPVALVERIINDFSQEGQTICDPFMGSGTAGVACVRNNRNFIGIELDQCTYDCAKQRISKELEANGIRGREAK